MSYRIPTAGPLLVTARLEHQGMERLGRFVLDTGAERTLLNSRVSVYLRLEEKPALVIWTVSGSERTTEAKIDRFDTLGRTARDFRVLIRPLPAALNVDGLLGLDFLREMRLTLDFRAGVLTVG